MHTYTLHRADTDHGVVVEVVDTDSAAASHAEMLPPGAEVLEVAVDGGVSMNVIE
jgi:hypothetical protein